MSAQVAVRDVSGVMESVKIQMEVFFARVQKGGC